MATRARRPVTDRDIAELSEKLQAAAELLERVAADRGLLAALSPEQRRRLVRAAGEVHAPDPAERRRLVKTIARLKRVAKRRRDEDELAGAGIRVLRRQPVFTTPPAFAPRHFQPHDVPPGDADQTAATAAEATAAHVGERA